MTEPKLEISASRHFPSWLKSIGGSLALSTYQAGKLFLLGTQVNGRLSVFERTFNRCMGLWSNGQTIWMSSLYQLWRFENALQADQNHQGYDRLFVPQLGYTTGDIDIHDITVDGSGRVIFVNTLFSCLATVSETHSFQPLWKPPFISRLAAEDRCHLNGMAVRDQTVTHITAVSDSDVGDGWRDHRRDGGVVVDVRSGETVAQGLSMPHSPRWHQGRLWLLESGTGYLCTVDLASGSVERIAFCPGYARGLVFVGDFAIVGLSRARDESTFAGLSVHDTLAEKHTVPRCGLAVFDLRTGDLVHWLRFEGIVRELYDVAFLPQATRPMALGFVSDEIRYMVSLQAEGTLD